MESILSGLITLVLLVVLQAVLGFDNLLYISLESKKAPIEDQPRIRLIGISLAIILRIVLLLALYNLIHQLQEPFLHLEIGKYFSTSMNVHSVIVLIGGAFIIYTATKEIWHMISLEEHAELETEKPSSKSIIFWIVVMNVVFSIDSILSAMALTDNLWVMMTAIIISGILMIWLSDKVSTFLQKNRMYEVLGLFILLIVGIMLVTEGGHLAHISIFGNPIIPMSKTTFYFILGILVLVDIVQGKYQKKISDKKALNNGGQ
jgi:predicted tellurium resistance membrane protein TerC